MIRARRWSTVEPMSTTWPLLLVWSVATAVDDTPGPRYGHEMVYDEARNVTLLFGGFGPDGEPRSDTWAYDGTSWRLLAASGPTPRRWPAAT